MLIIKPAAAPVLTTLHLNISVILHEIEFTYARSSGPGGQNVNKVNSKAILRWNVKESTAIDETVRVRLLEKLESKLNQEGDLIVMSDVFRDQPRNKEECLAKLQAQITEALTVPKKRKKTKASYASKQRNKESNKKHSEKKKARQGRY